jgi:type II secretory pathway predicted ATPase ExeA
LIEKLQAHYGFSRMPFGRNLAPGMLHRHASHNEAVARITWCISERAIGVWGAPSLPDCGPPVRSIRKGWV